jgi:hypothetical protein
VAALLCLGAAARPSAAQAPRYDAAQFACAAYEVRVHTAVNTELQGRPRVESLRRTGTLMVRGAAIDSGVALEAWWDSLRLWRRSDDQTLEPDAEGVLGGRYRGRLMADGRFFRTAAPWIPDDVAEVSDLTTALDDLFPHLPPAPLRRGERAASVAGDQFVRLADSSGRARYRITSASATSHPADSARSFAVEESESSDGILVWGTGGLLRWDRTVIAETRVMEDPKRAFRSRVEQRIEVRRTGSCPVTPPRP